MGAWEKYAKCHVEWLGNAGGVRGWTVGVGGCAR